MIARKYSVPQILFLCSGIISILAEFLNWTYEFSPWGFYFFFDQSAGAIIYLSPLIAGILICIAGPLMTRTESKLRYLYFIILLLALELTLSFLFEMFSVHDRFLWQYLGIYIQSLASGLLFFAIILQFSSPLKTAENPDSA